MSDGDRWLPVSTAVLAVVIVVLVASVGVAAPSPIGDDDSASGASAGEESTGVHEVAVSGPGFVDEQYETVQDHPGPPYVWSTESLEVDAVVGGEPGTEYVVCADATDGEGDEIADLGCETVTIGSDGREMLTFVAEWSGEDEERVWITVEVEPEEAATERYYETAAVTLLHPEGDLSGDGLTNAREVELGTDFTIPDTSGNGLTDWEEVRVYGTDPLEADTSGDGINDGTIARFPGNLDPTQPYILHLYVGGVLVAFAVLIVGGGALGWKAMQRYSRDGEPDDTPTASPDASAHPEPPSDADPPEAASTGVEMRTSDEDGDPPLTKEEEICRLLREHAGRMKQSKLVEETDWSQATVSRLLTQLEQEGRVTKLRAGRENIVELRDPDSTERTADAR
jgi:hypothetical protein